MKKSKRGAIELSITTIIIIVLGITLLSLGLVLVRNIFQKTEILSAEAFARAEGEIGKLSGVDKPLTISPNRIQVNKGGAKTVDVILAHFGQGTWTTAAMCNCPPTRLSCIFGDQQGNNQQSRTYSILSGEQIEITLIIDEQGGDIGTKYCTIEATTGTNILDTLIVDVTQRRGFLG